MSQLKPIALQLYTLREALAADFEGVVRQVAAMGYIGVEPFAGMPCPLDDAAALFAELGLEVFNSHIPYPDEANAETVLAIAEAFSLERVCIAFMPPDEFETADAIKAACAKLNQAGEFARDNKLSLGYHNHWWEFRQMNGSSTLDLMLAELSADVFLQIDTYWAQVGGMDAVEVVKTAGARAPLIHLKDGSLIQEDNMTAVGGGKMDVPAIVAATENTAEWHIVELDRCATDMLEAVHDSYRYLTANGLVRGKV